MSNHSKEIPIPQGIEGQKKSKLQNDECMKKENQRPQNVSESP
ncbi:hypothetical protein [Leptospira adleri]|nr:hypothetical protein [Leptospira adleri]